MDGILYLLRHGRAEGDEKQRYKGTLDVPLSAEGSGQVRRTTAFLKQAIRATGMEMGGVYCSTLRRARSSALIVARAFGLEPREVPELGERDFGLWEGLSFDEISERYPDDFNAWAGNPLRFSPMGGESTLEVRDRVMPAITEIIEGLAGRAAAVVAHGGVNRIVLAELVGMPLENIFRIEQDNACVNVVEFHDGFPVLRLLNRAPQDDG